MRSAITAETDARGGEEHTMAFVVAGCISVCLSVCFAVFDFPQRGERPEIVLENRINPNIAPASSLARLLGVGISRAAAIVAYRETFKETKANRSAFEKAGDLEKVKGIGPKTVEEMRQWLKFE